METDLLVIGGGVIGVSSAYYLQKAGRRVTLMEQGPDLCSGSSWGNAGWISPRHSVPLASPGAVGKALRWMFRPASPFYVKPRLDPALISWLMRFRSATNGRAVRRTTAIAWEFAEASLALYDETVRQERLECEFNRKGLLHVYRTQHEYREALVEMHLLRQVGIACEVLEGDRALELEPALKPGLAGAVFHPSDAHVQPYDFVNGLAARIEAMGGEVRLNTAVTGFELSGKTVARVKTSNGDFTANQVVLAAGAWSTPLVRDLRLKLPIQPAKGYSITFENVKNAPSRPVMQSEAHVGVTPFGNGLRLAGTLELSGINDRILPRRVQALRNAAREYLQAELPPNGGRVWCGLRPMTPDNLPVIGAPAHLQNLIVAAGHSMTGVTLGPATGKLVAQIAMGEKPYLSPEPFSPARFQ